MTAVSIITENSFFLLWASFLKFRYNQSHMVRMMRYLLYYLPVAAILSIGALMLGCSADAEQIPQVAIGDKPDARMEPAFIMPSITATAIPSLEPTRSFTPTPDSTLESGNPSAPTATSTFTMTPTSRVTQGPAPTLPALFIPPTMKPAATAITYIADMCSYLENRWDDEKSNPGTVVVPIMFHSVVQPGRLINDYTSISMEYFEYFMEKATELEFSTITAEELVGFLEHNQAIPERSMIMILDDRRPGVTELFMPYLEENDWTLTLGWIATDTTRDRVWETMTELASTGRLDVQSHGYDHTYIQEYFKEEEIRQELFLPIEVIESRFGTTPIAHVWAGGNFTPLSIALAEEAGYKIGFSAYSRGPILYNWIPLGEPEIAMDAPLMVLPRFWSTAAVQALMEAVLVSEAAKLNADEYQDAELAYYQYYCQPD